MESAGFFFVIFARAFTDDVHDCRSHLLIHSRERESEWRNGCSSVYVSVASFPFLSPLSSFHFSSFFLWAKSAAPRPPEHATKRLITFSSLSRQKRNLGVDYSDSYLDVAHHCQCPLPLVIVQGIRCLQWQWPFQIKSEMLNCNSISTGQNLNAFCHQSAETRWPFPVKCRLSQGYSQQNDETFLSSPPGTHTEGIKKSICQHIFSDLRDSHVSFSSFVFKFIFQLVQVDLCQFQLVQEFVTFSWVVV